MGLFVDNPLVVLELWGTMAVSAVVSIKVHVIKTKLAACMFVA